MHAVWVGLIVAAVWAFLILATFVWLQVCQIGNWLAVIAGALVAQNQHYGINPCQTTVEPGAYPPTDTHEEGNPL